MGQLLAARNLEAEGITFVGETYNHSPCPLFTFFPTQITLTSLSLGATTAGAADISPQGEQPCADVVVIMAAAGLSTIALLPTSSP